MFMYKRYNRYVSNLLCHSDWQDDDDIWKECLEQSDQQCNNDNDKFPDTKSIAIETEIDVTNINTLIYLFI